MKTLKLVSVLLVILGSFAGCGSSSSTPSSSTSGGTGGGTGGGGGGTSPKALFSSWTGGAYAADLTAGSYNTPFTAVVTISSGVSVCDCTLTFALGSTSGNTTTGTCTQTGACTTVSGTASNCTNGMGWCGSNGVSTWTDNGTDLTFGGSGITYQ